MARTDNTAHNRDRILQAAERLFAENGFDATSVGSVAEAAGVNKALVYYYFENKDDLLASLFADLMADMRKRVGAADAPPSLDDKVAAEVSYLMRRRRTLALLLMQALKRGGESPTLFQAAGKMIERELVARGFPPPAEESGPSEEYTRALVHEFFTGIMPVVTFVTLRDRFCTHFGLDDAQADTLFLEALKRSHFASHVEPSSEE